MRQNAKSIPLQMEKLIKEFQDQITASQSKYSTCDLGSCQYETASYTYHFVLKALNLSQEFFEKLFGITYDKPIPTEEEFIKELRDIALEQYDKDEEPEPVINTIEDYYKFCRDSAWDLWSAAINPLPNFKMETNLDLSRGGPILNEMTESENWQVGVEIAYTTFLYKTPITAYAEFST